MVYSLHGMTYVRTYACQLRAPMISDTLGGEG
jgi:hypothetical protein